eukprot:m.236611 g.236611  ORF g.236611 m.236611 type:complete len:163 (+) comp19350_c0_seq14:372-860(+)
MPPKKKKGGASEPTRFKIRVNTFHIGPGHREPVTCELVSTTPINKAKLLIEKAVSQELQISRGSLYFGQWQYYLMSNSSPDSVEHKVRRLDGGSITDIMWISRLGLQDESFISLALNEDTKRWNATWYLNISEIPSFRKKLTASERAVLDAAKRKVGKKKKK